MLAPRTGNVPAGLVMRGVHVWRLDLPNENGPDDPTGTRETHTDGAGTCDLRGLQPGAWRVEVASPALSFDRRMDVPVEDGRCVELHHELQRAGVLQVAVVGASWFGLQREGEQAPVVMAIARGDFATFAGLAPGRYVVTRFHSDSRVEPLPIGTGTVVAGRTTWLDLRAASVRRVVRGEVRSGSDPVAGARVRTIGSTTTAADGSFRLDCGYRVNFRDWSLSVVRGGATWLFQPPGSYPATEVNAVLQLGTHGIDLEVRDAAGRAVPGHAELQWQPAAAANPVESVGCRPHSFSCSMQIANVATRIGPMPEVHLAGRLEFDGGKTLAIRTAVPHSGPLALTIPAPGTLRIRVSRSPMPLADVRVLTWLGPGAAPAAADFETADGCRVWSTVSANEDGIAIVQSCAGEILVRMEAPGLAKRVAPVRLRFEPGTETTVDLVFPEFEAWSPLRQFRRTRSRR